MTDVYDRQLSFEERCDELAKRIDAGEVPSTLQLARALDLPLSYVNSAVALATIEFFRGRGPNVQSQ